MKQQSKEPRTYMINVCGIDVTVCEKKIKNINIRINFPSAEVKASVPLYCKQSAVEAFILKNIAWIDKNREKILSDASKVKPDDNEHITVFGKQLKIIAAEGRPSDYPAESESTLTVYAKKEKLSDKAYIFSLAENYACTLLINTVLDLNEYYSGKIGKRASFVTLRRMKTRYASINVKTAKMNISRNLYEKDKYLIEYVVVHELCHLLEANHSPRFHALTRRFLPDADIRRKLLKRK